MEVISRKEARERGLTRYFTGKPCKHGHLSDRLTSDGNCKECSREKDRKKYRDNPEHFSEKARRYRKENPISTKLRREKYYAENREKICEKAREERRMFPEKTRQRRMKSYYKHREKSLQDAKEWRSKNPELLKDIHRNSYIKNRARYIQKANARRAEIVRQGEVFIKYKEGVEAVYNECADMGRDYHVDHIIPLNNPLVSGLHVPWNLEIVTSEYNLWKSNKLLPEYVTEVYI